MATLRHESPHLVGLFQTQISWRAVPGANRQQYDVNPDRQQFLMSVSAIEGDTAPISMVLNWDPANGGANAHRGSELLGKGFGRLLLRWHPRFQLLEPVLHEDHLRGEHWSSVFLRDHQETTIRRHVERSSDR